MLVGLNSYEHGKVWHQVLNVSHTSHFSNALKYHQIMNGIDLTFEAILFAFVHLNSEAT
jgi:hypothetical protein